MFNLFRKPRPRQLTEAMSQALAREGLPPGVQPSTLSVVQRNGSYAGRRVSYFRAFDPVRVAERGLQIRSFTDLDAHRDLVLGSGHVESNGAIVVSARFDSEVPRTLVRRAADRSAHTDDEQVVFPTQTT